MNSIYNKIIGFVVIIALMVIPCSAIATDGTNQSKKDDQIEIAKMTTDALLVRPLGIVSTALGFGLFIVSVPFSALGGNTGEAWNALVAKPAEFTFRRPLGQFDD